MWRDKRSARTDFIVWSNEERIRDSDDREKKDSRVLVRTIFSIDRPPIDPCRYRRYKNYDKIDFQLPRANLPNFRVRLHVVRRSFVGVCRIVSTGFIIVEFITFHLYKLHAHIFR